MAKRAQSYTAYGHSSRLRVPTLGFNGERYDGILHGYALGNGYRLYRPQLMRFSSPDNMSPFGKGGPNAYAYCQNDPINRRDQSGHFWEKIKSFLSPASEAKQMSLRPMSLTMLPSEMISKIAGMMEPQTLRNFSAVSKRINAVVESTLKTSELDVMLSKESTNADQLVLLAKVSKGMTNIPKVTPGYYGYSPDLIDELIVKVNRAHYVPNITWVQQVRDERLQVQLGEEISEAVLTGQWHPLL